MSQQLDYEFIRAVELIDYTWIRRTLEDGADIHTNNDEALRFAVNNNLHYLAKMFLAAGADVHAKNDAAILIAAGHGNIFIIRLLLEAGANVHAGGDFGLRDAAAFGRFNVASLWIQHGAPLTALFDESISKNNRAKLILEHAAIFDERFEAVMMLEPADRIRVLEGLYPDLKRNQIVEKLTMMEVLGLDAAQMGVVWREKHPPRPAASATTLSP